MAQKLTDAQWGDIRTQWIATNRAVREIGREFGVSPAAIRKQSEKNGWGPRNAPEQVRGMVASHLAGSHIGSHWEPQTEIEKAISDAATDGIEDMVLSLRIGRKILMRCSQLLDLGGDDAPFLDPKNLSAVASTWRTTVDGIRKIRGLDDPAKNQDEQMRPIGIGFVSAPSMKDIPPAAREALESFRNG